jgi:hypothetical protein
MTGLCAGFAAIVVAEAALLMPRENGPRDEVPRDIAQDVEKLAPADIDSNISTILERPLFTSSRTGDEDSDSDEDSGEANTAALLDRRLSGVAIGPDGPEALFQHEDDKPVTVKVGSKIDGWTVKAIENDQVVLNSGSGDRVIRLTDSSGGRRTVPKPRVQKAKAPPRPAAAKPAVARPAAARPPAARPAAAPNRNTGRPAAIPGRQAAR